MADHVNGELIADEKHVAPSSLEAYDQDIEQDAGIVNKTAPLHKDLKGRHMQMIAIGMRLSRP
jgi:amino acid permease